MQACIVLAFACCLTLSACTVAVPREDFTEHAMTVNGDGDILGPVRRGATPPPEGEDAQREVFCPLPAGEFEAYVDRMFAAVERKRPKEVLVFVHGGLNSLAASTRRVSELISKYDEKGESGELPYPILINWDSGLWESLADHLVRVRQGEKAEISGWLSGFFYAVADVGRTLFRAPVTIGYTLHNDASAFPSTNVSGGEKTYSTFERENPRLIYPCLAEKYPGSVSLGREINWEFTSGRLYLKSLLNTVTFPFQYLFAPPIDGFGAPAWEAMQRRAKVLFNKPEQFDIDRNPSKIAAALEGKPLGAMTVFMRRLNQYRSRIAKNGEIKVTLVAHSMGTFIVNEMLRAYPDLHYENIVYMAGADSIRNTVNAVRPYMMRPEHSSTTFYNLTLHPQAEVEEASGWGFLPRGSLLVWVDNFFSTPHTHYDRTVGRWDNFLPAAGEIPTNLWPRVKVKAFDEDSNVARHGDFTQRDFWLATFREPGADACNPWPPGNSASCLAPRPAPKCK